MAIACRACRHLYGVGFQGHSDDELAAIEGFRIGHEAFRNGAVIADSARGPFLFSLYSGWAIESVRGGNGGRKAARLWLPGDLVGLGTLGPGPSDARIVAATDATICRFDPDRWRAMLAAPAIGERLMEIVLHQRAAADDELNALRQLPALGRTARFIVTTYAALERRRIAHNDRFRLPLMRQHVAELLGLTAAHLRRSFAQLQQAGLACIENGQVRILDREALWIAAGEPALPDRLQPLL